MPHSSLGGLETLKIALLFIGGFLFGAMGGGVKHLSETLNSGAVKRVLIYHAVIGSFCGTLSSLYFYDRGASFPVILGMAGLSGFGGYVLLNNVLRFVYRHFPGSESNNQNQIRGENDDREN